MDASHMSLEPPQHTLITFSLIMYVFLIELHSLDVFTKSLEAGRLQKTCGCVDLFMICLMVKKSCVASWHKWDFCLVISP